MLPAASSVLCECAGTPSSSSGEDTPSRFGWGCLGGLWTKRPDQQGINDSGTSEPFGELSLAHKRVKLTHC